MLSKETKERIAKEAEKLYPYANVNFEAIMGRNDVQRVKSQAYIAGAEAEALRSHELIEAYNDLCTLMNDELNTMEKHSKGYNTSRETIYKVIELQEKIKALNNYNKTDK